MWTNFFVKLFLNALVMVVITLESVLEKKVTRDDATDPAFMDAAAATVCSLNSVSIGASNHPL